MREIGKTIAKLHNSGIIHGNLDVTAVLVLSKPGASLSVRLTGFSHGIHSTEPDDKATEMRTLEKDLQQLSPVFHSELVLALYEGYEADLLGKEEILERITVSRLSVIL